MPKLARARIHSLSSSVSNNKIIIIKSKNISVRGAEHKQSSCTSDSCSALFPLIEVEHKMFVF